MNEKIKAEIIDKIESYKKIIITRHIKPDGDAIGSTMGLREALRLTYPEKDIRISGSDGSEYLAFFGKDTDDIGLDFYNDALIIVLDTASFDRISDKNCVLGKETIKIDHHIDIKPYGDLSWVEDSRSSCSEMIASLIMTSDGRIKMNASAATYIYTGMVTDSGRFKFSSTTGETLRTAAYLLDFGIDTETLFAHLYLDEFDYLKFKAQIYRKMKITENGVAYVYVDMAMKEKYSLTDEQASNTVFFLDTVKNSLIWLAFIENGDGSIRVRLRSRFVTINALAEKYGGGGHACASGATVHSKKEFKALLADADKLLGQYKSENTGWL